MIRSFLALKDKSSIENKIISNQQLAEELHKPVIIQNIEKWEVYSSFINIISGADLADRQLISKLNTEIVFLLCVIDISVNTVVSLKDIKKVFQVLMLLFKY